MYESSRRDTLKPWTTLEIEALRYLGPRVGGRECAESLDRSYESVRSKAKQIGVPLRRTSFDPKLTQGTRPAVLQRVRELAEAPLCPACAKRYVSVRLTGLCAPCHWERRVAVHEDEIARLEAQRTLWAARSKLQRRRRSLILLEES